MDFNEQILTDSLKFHFFLNWNKGYFKVYLKVIDTGNGEDQETFCTGKM